MDYRVDVRKLELFSTMAKEGAARVSDPLILSDTRSATVRWLRWVVGTSPTVGTSVHVRVSDSINQTAGLQMEIEVSKTNFLDMEDVRTHLGTADDVV